MNKKDSNRRASKRLTYLEMKHRMRAASV